MTTNRESNMKSNKENSNRLLDAVMTKLNLRNDAALSRTLEVAPPVISKIRHGHLPVGASMLIRMHEETGYSIRELRDLLGHGSEKFRATPDRYRDSPRRKASTAQVESEIA